MRTVGIDLGTTNTVLASNGEVLRLRGVEAYVPSAVAFLPEGRTAVGSTARARRAVDPRNTILAAKRVIGERWASIHVKKFAESYPYELVQTGVRGVGFRTRAGVHDAVDIAALVVRAACTRVDLEPESCVGVVSVPAAFSPGRRAATITAIERAGLRVTHVVDEPVAVALAYLARSSLKYCAVYDLGGGTFDCAILDCSQYPLSVVALGGDAYLGGDDIDRALARMLRERALRASGWDLGSDREIFDKLVDACERAKIALSTETSVPIAVEEIDPAAPAVIHDMRLSREELVRETASLVAQTFSAVDDMFGRAKLKTRDIDAVFLAGGASKLPGLRERVADYFGKQPRQDIDPTHVVGIGASLAAARPGLAGLLDADGPPSIPPAEPSRS